MVSAAFAGMAGTLYAMNFSTVTAAKFDFNTSILVLVFVVLGGLGNIWGFDYRHAALLTLLPEAAARPEQLPYAHLRNPADCNDAVQQLLL